jgi:hypothetical protein
LKNNSHLLKQATVGNKNEALNFYRQSLELWRNLKQDKVVANLEEKIAKLEANGV